MNYYGYNYNIGEHKMVFYCLIFLSTLDKILFLSYIMLNHNVEHSWWPSCCVQWYPSILRSSRL